VSLCWRATHDVSAMLKDGLPAAEEAITNGGYDWRYQQSASVSVSVENTTVHSGLRSVAVDFNGSRQDPGIFQFVAVQPDTEYEFSAHMKGEGLDGTNGPRFSVVALLHRQF
jgi:hypothetical protein